MGVDHEWTFKETGSKFTILTYKEDTKSHEGWTGDFVIFDEPPPRDKWTANRRGLVANDGTAFIAMTALDEPWLLDEIVLKPDSSVGIVGGIPITANPTLSNEAIRVFEKDLPESERIARIQGGWMQLTGRVWKNFEVNKHTVEPFKVPPDWPVSFQVDFHLNLPHAVSFCAVDPYDRFFIVAEIWENMGAQELAEEIIRRKNDNSWRLTYGEVDALSKGDVAFIRNRIGGGEDSFTIMQRTLNKHGIRLGVGSKDEKSYVKAVETRFKGPNGMPLLYVFNTLTETIRQIQRWTYDDNEKPRGDGHFPECIGRFTQAGLHYISPVLYSQEFVMPRLGIV